MKKNKMTSLAIATVTTVALLGGATFAWFMSTQVSAAVNVETGKIQISGLALLPSANKLPGEEILLTGIDNKSKTKVLESQSFKFHSMTKWK